MTQLQLMRRNGPLPRKKVATKLSGRACACASGASGFCKLSYDARLTKKLKFVQHSTVSQRDGRWHWRQERYDVTVSEESYFDVRDVRVNLTTSYSPEFLLKEGENWEQRLSTWDLTWNVKSGYKIELHFKLLAMSQKAVKLHEGKIKLFYCHARLSLKNKDSASSELHVFIFADPQSSWFSPSPRNLPLRLSLIEWSK